MSNYPRGNKNKFSPFGAAMVVLVVLVAGLVAKERFSDLFGRWLNPDKVPRQIKGEIFGAMPAPTQPALDEPIKKIVEPTKTRKMVVKRIPQLTPGKRMPHPYWGPCTKCHLIQGGAPAGSQPITPVGKAWERASANFMKVGPPILPDTTRNHPPCGRCIKCHDIVVEVPI